MLIDVISLILILVILWLYKSVSIIIIFSILDMNGGVEIVVTEKSGEKRLVTVQGSSVESTDDRR